jgi:hypothetical protein
MHQPDRFGRKARVKSVEEILKFDSVHLARASQGVKSFFGQFVEIPATGVRYSMWERRYPIGSFLVTSSQPGIRQVSESEQVAAGFVSYYLWAIGAGPWRGN